MPPPPHPSRRKPGGTSSRTEGITGKTAGQGDGSWFPAAPGTHLRAAHGVRQQRGAVPAVRAQRRAQSAHAAPAVLAEQLQGPPGMDTAHTRAPLLLRHPEPAERRGAGPAGAGTEGCGAGRFRNRRMRGRQVQEEADPGRRGQGEADAGPACGGCAQRCRASGRRAVAVVSFRVCAVTSYFSIGVLSSESL